MFWPIFEGLAPADLVEVLGFCRRVRYESGEYVFLQGAVGDALYLIESGRVLVEVGTPNGDVATVSVLGPGDVFGEQALVSQADRRMASIAAAESLKLLWLPRAEFERLRRSHPSVDRFLFVILAAQARDVTQQLLDALYVDAETRVILRLGRIARAFDNGARTVRISLTQDQIASISGTTRPTVNRALRRAESAGILRLGRGRIDIVDVDGLRGLTC